jgi:hypothetical protein
MKQTYFKSIAIALASIFFLILETRSGFIRCHWALG